MTELSEKFRTPPREAAPMMRWWWFGPAQTPERIRRELTAMRDAGLRGAEVSYVYPMAEEGDLFLSEPFLQNLRHAGEVADELGLRLDITLGSGWSYGGAHIGPGHAARTLHWERFEIAPGAQRIPIPAAWPGDELVGAYLGDGSIQEAPDDVRPLAWDADGIRIPAGAGPRVVLFAISRLTGQNVKRAARGIEGPVLDHYSEAAIRHHIDVVAEPLVNAVARIGSVFCDSLEVYHGDWTPLFPQEFEARRGYPLLPELWKLDVDDAGSARLRADMGQTRTELYEDRFLMPLQAWARSKGVPLRVQGYGEPPAAVSSYRFVDQIEGEGWGWRDITQTRWASSGARVCGVTVVSSETWTWNHSPSFRATPLDLAGEVHEHILCGINQFFGHGWPSTPADGPGVGNVFYAAAALDDRNAWWPVAPDLWSYIARLSWIMRQGTRIARVGLYVPIRDIDASLEGLDLSRRARTWIGSAIPAAIRDAGHDFDLFDDASTAFLAPDAFDVIVLPRASEVPSAEWIRRARAAGALVIAVDRAPGDAIADLTVPEADLRAALQRRLASDHPLVVPERHRAAVGVTHRRSDDNDIFFVANTAATPAVIAFAPTGAHENWALADPRTGDIRALAAGEIELAPYQAIVIVGGVEGDRRVYKADREVRAERWSVAFPGEVQEPISFPHRWEDSRTGYSGSASYRAAFTLDRAGDVALDLGGVEALPSELADRGIRGPSFRAKIVYPVGVAAEVFVDGRRAGSAWSAPFRVELGALAAGDHEIEVVVHNTTANRLAVDEHLPAVAEAAERAHGRRFRIQDLDLALEGVESGLLQEPRLRVHTR
ncbi:hypothetical protein GCM10010922_12930 [Microbacterium sorbitolivorans]|uniref:Glycoside hydrolase n=1 Tax=Microbacterium sorbitolivorans TaxID=1867410 RepID=A0A367XY02_9MICO|nr:glycosyl hydrolase [Microbacterium sorbitolivorans]RCK58279.1 hypothetical protein DTO57_11375 [Microbacterium sorbitolivorans]GGF38987.1 hypothetical protein GCM10010922_12930 [Microbacterium sorbitolivorans]